MWIGLDLIINRKLKGLYLFIYFYNMSLGIRNNTSALL